MSKSMKARSMKSKFAVMMAVAGCALAAPAFGQVSDPNLPFPTGPDDTGSLLMADPDMKFDVMEHDFGKIDDSGPVEFDFRFTNKGAGLLKIGNVQTTCGCTVPTLERKEYSGDESGVIKVRFDPKHKSGPQTKVITVETNDRSQPRIQLTIKSDIQPLVKMDPQFVSMEPIEKGKTLAKLVTVTGRAKDFTVTLAKAEPADIFQTRIVETKDVVVDKIPQRQSVVEISLKPGAPVGRHNASVMILTNEVKAGEMKLGVSAEVLGDLQVNPARISLGVPMVGADFSGEVKIVHKSAKPFKIRGTDLRAITEPPVPMEVIVTASPTGEGTTIKLVGKAGETPLRYTGELVLSTDVAGEETIRVPVYLTIRPKGSAAVPTVGKAPPAATPFQNAPQIAPQNSPQNPGVLAPTGVPGGGSVPAPKKESGPAPK